MIMLKKFYNEHNNYFCIQLIDFEMLLNLGRQMKIPGYKVWKNVCSSGSFIESDDQGVDKINKTLYRYIKNPYLLIIFDYTILRIV